MTTAGLTVGVLGFLFLVFIPGMAAQTFAGKPKSERTWFSSVCLGSEIFVLVFLVFWAAGEFGPAVGFPSLSALGAIIDDAVDSILVMSGLSEGSIRTDALVWLFVAECLTAFVFGIVELFSAIKGSPFGRAKKGTVLETADMLVRTFLRYRKAGIRPRITVRFADGREPKKGECLRYGWNGREAVLLRDLDDPMKVEWVDLAGAAEIEFDNWGFLGEAEEHREGREREAREFRETVDAYRSVLNWMAPGLGDEIYGSKKRRSAS